MASSIAAPVPFEPFRDRARSWLGLTHGNGHALRTYGVVYGDGPLDRARFEPGVRSLIAEIPTPDWSRGRPGAGVMILHQGKAEDYLVMGWWDRQNELPLEVWIRYDDGWAPSRHHESVCVWDLEILSFERDAWVATMLSDAQPGSLRAYLEHAPA